MGRAILDAAAAARVAVVAAVVPAASPLLGRPVEGLAPLRHAAAPDPGVAFDVVVDFSSVAGFDAALAAARAHHAAFVSGTTGLSAEHRQALAQAGAEIPVLWASNFSLGVAVLHRLVAAAAGALGPGFDAEVIEAHHAGKRDAPSGTALTLGAAIASARAQRLADVACHARHGITGPRREGEIGFASIRAADLVGEHTVLFAGPGERLELTHRATDRGVFARGALHAATWIAGRAPGRYELADTLESA